MLPNLYYVSYNLKHSTFWPSGEQHRQKLNFQHSSLDKSSDYTHSSLDSHTYSSQVRTTLGVHTAKPRRQPLLAFQWSFLCQMDHFLSDPRCTPVQKADLAFLRYLRHPKTRDPRILFQSDFFATFLNLIE